MTGEEMSFRPVALAGDLDSASPATLAAAPQTQQRGIFHAFEAAGEPGQRWVVSPAVCVWAGRISRQQGW